MSSYFFLQPGLNNVFFEEVKNYSEVHKKQIYIINQPLGDSKYKYEYQKAFVILCPKQKITFIDLGNSKDEFEEFKLDFLEDLGSISDKYQYKDQIGRPRKWIKDLIYSVDKAPKDLDRFFKQTIINNSEDQKLAELLITLLTGSINDIKRVGVKVPNTLLEKVKQRILLFDGDQTRFIYDHEQGNKVTIQGLSGTGKTELLLHKLKDIYLNHDESKTIFTCHNKILAQEMRRRIPEFFNFMKVEEQILWNERLWCVHAWGSNNNKDSGTYRKICDYYNLNFYTYSPSRSFNDVCTFAIEEIKEMNKVNTHGKLFDYVLLDESQDFPESFFELCELVTQEVLYIAGDVFQSIFDVDFVSKVEPNFLLSKCYRTDPKTLMFSHAVGMGLFEESPLRWLDDEEWKLCGYQVSHNETNTKCILRREPLRRFDDQSEGIESISIFNTDNTTVEESVNITINKIIDEFPDTEVDDIAIILIGSNQFVFSSSDKLEYSIPRKFGWTVNKAHENKENIPGQLFISNKNNVKGLEFSFVICIADRIRSGYNYRNALYMMLTRSFLKSFFLVPKSSNEAVFEQFSDGWNEIYNTGKMEVTIPSVNYQEQIKTKIRQIGKNQSYNEFIESIFEELEIPEMWREPLFESTKSIIGHNFDRENAIEIINFNFSRMEK